MSETLARHMKSASRPGVHGSDDHLPREEQKALKTLQREAKEKGTDLAHGGKGGLPPSLVLTVLRRDDYKCSCNADHGKHDGEVCGTRDDITLHHMGGIAKNRWLSKQGHHNVPKNIITICEPCHDVLHKNARKRGDDSSQVTPEGDEGTKRDRGLPLAKAGGDK